MVVTFRTSPSHFALLLKPGSLMEAFLARVGGEAGGDRGLIGVVKIEIAFHTDVALAIVDRDGTGLDGGLTVQLAAGGYQLPGPVQLSDGWRTPLRPPIRQRRLRLPLPIGNFYRFVAAHNSSGDRKCKRMPRRMLVTVSTCQLAWRIPRAARVAFRYPNFRLFMTARFLAIVSSEMISVAVGWQIYALTHRPLDLGLVGLAQFAPGVLLFLVAGHTADRHSRQAILRICYSGVRALCRGSAGAGFPRTRVGLADLRGAARQRRGAGVQWAGGPGLPSATGEAGAFS